MFANDLAKFQEKVTKRLKFVETNTVQVVASMYITQSPIGSPLGMVILPNHILGFFSPWESGAEQAIKNGYIGGTFKASWRLSLDAPSSDYAEDPDKTGKPSFISVDSALKSTSKVGNVYYLVNNQPYAERLMVEGWSTQAPEGWVTSGVIMKFNNIVVKSAAKARSLY